MKQPLRVAVGLAVIALVVAWLLRPSSSKPASARGAVPDASAGERAGEPDPNVPPDDHGGPRTDGLLPLAADVVDAGAARDAMRARMMRATAMRAAASGGDTPSGARPGADWYERPGKMEPSYIQSRIRDLFWPQVRTCFAEARTRVPKLAGTLAIKLLIVGDEAIGGIVESASVDPSRTTIHDDALATCVTESMLFMTFRAPEAGGAVAVIYPFVLGDETLDGGHLK